MEQAADKHDQKDGQKDKQKDDQAAPLTGVAAVLKAIIGTISLKTASSGERFMWAAAASTGIASIVESIGTGVAVSGSVLQGSSTAPLAMIGLTICGLGVLPLGFGCWAILKSIKSFTTQELREEEVSPETENEEIKRLPSPDSAAIMGVVLDNFELVPRR